MDYAGREMPRESLRDEAENPLSSLFLQKLLLNPKRQTKKKKNKNSGGHGGKKAPQKKPKDLNDIEKLREEFINITSHELNTPLTSLKIFVGLLEKQIVKNKDKKYLPFVEKIDDQTEKLLRLTSDLLDVSKIGCGKFLMDKKTFNLRVCIADLIKQINKAENKHKIVFTTNYRGSIYGDKDKISQVVANLLTNAIKYSPEYKNVGLTVKKKKDSIVVSVRDYGLGIRKTEQKRIFDRFHRNLDGKSATFPGLGLGLYISSEIVKAHGGKIWVDSKLKKGSVFAFSIPLVQPLNL